MSKKEIRVLELAMARKARQSELQDFINNSSFQAVMRKTVAFLTDDRSDRIQLKISTGDASFTDGRAITVGMEDYFFSPEFSRYEWVSIFKALLAHEVQHINSSNFKDIKDIMKKYTAMMTGKGIPDQLLGKIAKDMLNIMEDGRIENIIVHKLPGYKMPLILMNQGTADLSTLEEKADTPGEEFLDFVNSSLCYVKTGRRPYGISVYAGTRFEKEYEAVLPYFDLAVDARSSKDCKDLCLKVLKSTADYFAELLKAEIDQQKAAGNSGGKGDPGEGDGSGDYEYTSNGECEYNDSPNGSVSERAAKEAEGGKPGKKSDKKAGKKDEDKDDKGKKRGKGDKEGKDGNGGKDGKEDGDADGKDGENGDSANKTGRNALRMPRDPSSRSNTENWTDDFSGDGAEDYGVRELTADELQALRQGVMDELDAVEKENKVEKSKEEVTREKIAERYSGEYTRSFLELFPVIPNTALPSEVERAGRKLENDVERVLRVKRTEKRNMRVGQVCARDLYRVGMRDPHVFMRKGQPMKADLATFLLLDNSGSMGSQGARTKVNGRDVYLDKSTLSRTAAGIIERGLSKFTAMKISLFDVSGSQIRHATLKKFDERSTGSKCYNSQPGVGIGGGNKDGYSIRVATADLMARREAKKVLVVLSDGLPSDYNGGTRAGLNDVREAVREARRKGVIVIPIMFGRASDREQMKDNFSYMYGQFISCDPIDITDEFTKLFTKLIQTA